MNKQINLFLINISISISNLIWFDLIWFDSIQFFVILGCVWLLLSTTFERVVELESELRKLFPIVIVVERRIRLFGNWPKTDVSTFVVAFVFVWFWYLNSRVRGVGCTMIFKRLPARPFWSQLLNRSIGRSWSAIGDSTPRNTSNNSPSAHGYHSNETLAINVNVYFFSEQCVLN